MAPDVLIRLDRNAGEPLRSQLEAELRAAIRSGRLRAGERLPSSRQLAQELRVSRGLVLECYSQLRAEGYLTTRTGSGTRVAAGAPGPSLAARPSPTPPGPAIDFRHGIPDLASFPRRDWAWALRNACRTAPVEEIGYGDPRGTEALREAIAGHLRRARGAVADPAHVVVCAGVSQGVNLVLRVLARRGVSRVAFEDPGQPHHRGGTKALGIEPVAVPVDTAGIDTEALAAADVGAIVVAPAHQFPTGARLSDGRREALIAWAKRHGATVIEDDYDADFRYGGDHVGVLQGMAPAQVATVGSVSLSLAPALRLGWILCPAGLAADVAVAKRDDDRGSPALDQLALAALFETGRYERHLRRMRAIYAARRDALLGALARHAPRNEVRGLTAGLHGAVLLPDGVGEDTVTALAGERSIGVYAMSRYSFGAATPPPALVLGYGNLGEGAIARGIAAIGDLLGGARPTAEQ